MWSTWYNGRNLYDIWEREEDLENMKDVVAEFKKRLNTKARRQDKLDIV